jgi:hypothetical protein
MNNSSKLTSKEQFLVDSIFNYYCSTKVKPVFEGVCPDCGMEIVQVKTITSFYGICLSELAIKTLKGLLFEEEKRTYEQEHK